jgi:hypothetical protein
VDDEEWISAVLPSRTGKPGRVLGGLTIAHFSFYTQEQELLRTDILERYAQLAGLTACEMPPLKPVPFRKRIKGLFKKAPPAPELQYPITLA